ncbi:MAG: hypothetical protein IJ410_02620 [Oscillospiraceae bacterium]|nr:hypothetical protein [Oscillospiraceae bacterium]
MIINFILELFYAILQPLLELFNFPVIPVEFYESLNFFLDYMRTGMGVFNFFCPLSAIAPALDIFLSVWTIVHVYRLGMWFIQKIPMLNVK